MPLSSTGQFAYARCNPSPPPLKSRTSSNNSGPSTKEPAFIKSTWKIGWQTPTLMLSSYVLALAIAVLHLLLFRYLHGKEADGPNEVAPQSYISTVSNILANLFGFFLRAALAVAFVQHLWHLLRVSTMKVSTIELLFFIRSNPFVLLRPAALRAAPLLFALSILMWASQIVTSFPPGAITVVTTQRISSQPVVVPTFNASFMGNGSGADASTYSLSTLIASPPGGFVAQGLLGNKDASLLSRLAFQVLVSGQSFALPSPCGANCSYTMQYEGPFLNCNHTTTNLTIDGPSFDFQIYNGTWTDPHSTLPVQHPYNGTYTISRFTSSVYTPLRARADALFYSPNGSITLQQDRLLCIPARANFTVENTYSDNIESRTVTTNLIDSLINLTPLTYDNEVLVPGFYFVNGTSSYGTEPANWTTYALGYYRDNNIMSIIDAMMLELSGSFEAQVHIPASSGPTNDSLFIENVVWDPYLGSTTNSSGNDNAEIGGTIIDKTRFNTEFGQFSPFDSPHPAFKITQDLLNDYLFNITISMMNTYGEWNTTSNATTSNPINVYDFSRPLNLILPYFVSLILAVPFILIGGIALHNNGVSAIDGGFMQILATSTGSAVLHRAAAGGCLGGEESVSRELKDLELRFGEIIDREEPGRIKRAGFGVESEITPLKRGDNYGIANWI